MITDLSKHKDTYRVIGSVEKRTAEIADRPLLWEIPCIKTKGSGVIYTYSPTLLAFLGGLQRRTPSIKAKLLRLPDTRLIQNGDQEFTITFLPKQLTKVAKIVGARKRRHLSAESAENARERLARFRSRST